MNMHPSEPPPSDPSLQMMNFMMMFFSEIATSATHDLKNFLAIINENVGLLEDLYRMEMNLPLGADRMTGITGTIRHQIGRTDEILKKLNRFSRDLSSQMAVTDLAATMDLVLDLCSGIIRNHGAGIKITPSEKPVYLADPPFLLNLLLFRAVQTALNASEGNKILTITFAPAKKSIGLSFTIDNVKPGSLDNIFTSKEEIELTQILNVNASNIKNGFTLEWTR